MLNLKTADITQTRFYQDVFQLGIQEGRQEGEQKGRQEGEQKGRQEGEQKGRQEGEQKGKESLAQQRNKEDVKKFGYRFLEIARNSQK